MGRLTLALGLSACGGLADESKLPPDVKDPASLQTVNGALARYRGALATIAPALDQFLAMTGLLTDELASLPAPRNVGRSPYTAIDSRRDLSYGFEETYARLHRMRGQAREARGFLTAYAPDSLSALAGHLYAVEGYAEVWLADLFCSGIPLSTVDFNGDYTLAPGSSTGDVYRHALTLFDSALALTTDSLAFQALAAVGKGRALVALGRYAEAATAVVTVPDGYQYQVVFVPPTVAPSNGLGLLQGFANGGTDPTTATGYVAYPATPSVADQEGLVGLNYRTSNDPRTQATAQPGTDPFGNTMYFPAKYPVTGPLTYTVASSVEARLIEAEAALQAGDATTWLTKLNQLRTTVGLSDTTDPGTPEAQLDLLFRERAFWLFLTGHRQGDLRRLEREYHRPSGYPRGSAYLAGGGSYGSAVTAPVPAAEQASNPLYTGCLHPGA